MSSLEIVAACFGAVSVWLSTRQNVLSWPTAIVNVLLYVVIFHGARLYADMGLQLVYAALSVYGWWQWKFGGADHGTLLVTRTGPRLALVLLALALAGWLALVALLSRTDASLPWLDAGLTSASLVAQWMMTRKKLESWLVWIAVDVVYVPMFLYKQLYATAVLYAVFLVLAAMGWREWRRDWLQRPTAGAPA